MIGPRLTAVIIVALLAGPTAVALAATQVGIVRPTSEPARPSAALGAQLYAGNCASCHGIAGAGISAARPGAGAVPGAGPPLRRVGALAVDFYLRRGYMPLSSIHDEPGDQRVLFSDKEIRSLVAYVAGLGRGPAIPHPVPDPANISDGFSLFTDHCSGCHQLVGRGGFVTGAKVPPLQSIAPTQIAEAVRIGPYLMPRFSRTQISDRQLNAIIAYVQSTSHPDNRGGWGIGNLGPIPEGLVAWWIGAPLLVLSARAVSRRRRSG
ncbi:MAG: c-type cytochrome [Solirubrobacterales bacterium]|nr:c-type cytochrome [Solirubrobacterales bacterium]